MRSRPGRPPRDPKGRGIEINEEPTPTRAEVTHPWCKPMFVPLPAWPNVGATRWVVQPEGSIGKTGAPKERNPHRTTTPRFKTIPRGLLKLSRVVIPCCFHAFGGHHTSFSPSGCTTHGAGNPCARFSQEMTGIHVY